MKKIAEKWYLIVSIGFILFAALVFGIFGESSIISVHDNLDLFVAQFQMLKNADAFFLHDEYISFLGGISRDVLPSEFSLYSILYMILPSYWAYVTGYLLKIVIAIVSCILLARDFCGENYTKYKPLVTMTGLAYGILNVFPAFGISFASIPLVVYLIRKIYKKPSFKWYLALLLYPLLSYFSYFGLFILAYLVIALIWLFIRDKKFPGRILLAIVVLSAGYVACEYRLFWLMLFDDTATIRSTMEAGSYTTGQVILTILEGFAKGMFHAESVHTYLVMPVCLIYFVYLNFTYLRQKNRKAIFHDIYNLLMLILVFNSVVYGIYYWEGFRNVIETICPLLTGWQFNRTIFFNPFIWYAAFFLVLKRLYDTENKKAEYGANLLALLAVLLIVFSGTRYNDLYNTCVAKAYELLKDKQSDQLSYEEFYSTELFEEAKKDLNYNGQWAAAYGFHPAVLEYNDIATIDGYLGFYPQYYKEEFRKVIAPALERVPESAEYFDTWGARAYLYSGTDLSIVGAVRDYQVSDQNIYIDLDEFKALGGRYIFSRIELKNAQETGLTLAGIYEDESSPYTLYVYETTSRYQNKEHSQLTFEEMKSLTYDKEKMQAEMEALKQLVEEAEKTGEAKESERVIALYESLSEELNKMTTCYTVAQIVYYQDVNNEENCERQEAMLEDAIDFSDELNVALREVCRSPYSEAMKSVMNSEMVKSFAEYEEMTDREKELMLKENSLTQEYEQAMLEDFSVTYEGEEWNFDRLSEEGVILGQEGYMEVLLGIYREKNLVAGEIYLELLKIRNEQAEIAGYDNYAEYAYSEVYYRDYTVEDVEGLFEETKEEVVPVLEDMERDYNKLDTETLYNLPETTAKERLMKIRPYLDEISVEMAETFDYMMEYELYDMDEAAGKPEGVGFTTDLDYFGEAFIFDSPGGYYYDYTTAIHEFGHYHYSFRNKEEVLLKQSNLDLCEIHSQGLEMLYYEYADEILEGEAGEVFAFQEVYQMATNTVDPALLSEFEIEVYKNPDMTLEEMNKLYLELSEEYGIVYNKFVTEGYFWVDIPHLFSSPCYYISYLTSAYSSLDILTIADDDREEAIEKYLELTALPSYMGYSSAVEYVGLRDIFEEGIPKEIMEEAAEILEVH